MNGDGILIVDDEEGIRFALTRFFKKNGYSSFAAANRAEALSIVEKESIAAAIIDVRLDEGAVGVTLMEELKKIDSELVCIIVTGYGNISDAVDAMKKEAADYILKPIDNVKLLETVHKNLELASLKRENQYLKRELINSKFSQKLITVSQEVLEMVKIADKVKDSAASVFITGESGTGKEIMAQYIHFSSIRGSFAFVDVNCAALSETLLLSELFGHEKGSFTGASERKVGKFELADHGTLFLDEIGDMSLDAQSKLLRVLETGTFERLGGAKKISSDFRIIAATNKNPEQLVREGLFRSDLYYRLHIVHLHLPPLRDRPCDISGLVDYFVERFNEKYNKHVSIITEETRCLLRSYGWPGNVRELQNVINLSVLLSEGKTLTLRGLGTERASDCECRCFDMKGESARAVMDRERSLITEALNAAGGNKSEAARRLGVTRKTLAAKLAKYGDS
jgi:DNA-binding NtrC family response regulator